MMTGRKRLIGAAIIGAAVLPVVLLAFESAPWRGPGAGDFPTGEAVGLIYIEGDITGGRGSSGFSGDVRGADNVITQIRNAADDPEVKAVVLRLNTPGGTAAASQEIAREVDRLRESGKKVVASMGDLCASGGYWVASSADLIVASPATITGSIGVIMEVTQIEQLMKKVGVEVDVIKSGPHKDMGSPTRKLQENERALLQDMVDDIYVQFVEQVANGRKMDLSTVRGLADGRVFTGRQAKDLGLVDDFGSLEDAINSAAQIAGLSEGWTVKEFGKITVWERFLDLLEGGVSLNRLLGIPARLPLGPGRIGTVDVVRFR